ncbi:unnamed protein product [Ixodes persulcatus]
MLVHLRHIQMQTNLPSNTNCAHVKGAKKSSESQCFNSTESEYILSVNFFVLNSAPTPPKPFVRAREFVWHLFTQACMRMRRETERDALIAVRAAALWKLC